MENEKWPNERIGGLTREALFEYRTRNLPAAAAGRCRLTIFDLSYQRKTPEPA